MKATFYIFYSSHLLTDGDAVTSDKPENKDPSYY